MRALSKEAYITLRKLLTRLHVHAFLDEIATRISKSVPLPFITYDSIKLCLGFYTLVILEDVEEYHRFVKPGRGWCVVDVGAHVGVYTIEAAKAVSDEGKVVAIEPDPDNFRMLLFHIVLNKVNNVIPLRAALGSRIGCTELIRYGSPHNVISEVLGSRLGDVISNPRKVRVPLLSFDFVCERLSLEEVDLVKLDVEGAELDVINGMKKYIPQHIVGEWHGLTRLYKLESLLKDRGYKVLYKRSAHNIGVFYARHVR